MNLPFQGETVSTNNPQHIGYVVALVVAVVWALGASPYPWWVMVSAIGACIAIPLAYNRWWPKPKVEPNPNGGDIRFTVGAGSDGGHPGRFIFIRKQCHPTTPFIALSDEQTGGTLFVFSGPQDPVGKFNAPLGSMYLKLAKDQLPGIYWKVGPSASDWKQAFKIPTH